MLWTKHVIDFKSDAAAATPKNKSVASCALTEVSMAFKTSHCSRDNTPAACLNPRCTASKGSKTLLLLVVIIGLMLTSAVAKDGRGFGSGSILGGSRAAGTGGFIGGGRATTGGRTSASVTWGPTSTFWTLIMSFKIYL
ncbi:hypothetical protein SADUNF_Sadunf16G0008500 [Salix dunnii]|uniref:Uncharacterized protein n=1 Tax=Salix dunnii TaxID=1413687 RepID=A0A835MFB2_9ROSI|nr:hypothetical protein SADUNF_Sadunf16G0008500 [Salix dunnii]